MTDNTMRIWDAVCKTNPANTKQVNQRGGFTAINANSQIMEATRQFGPIGIGWGYVAGDPIFHDKLVIVPVTLWHGDRDNTFGPVFGCEEWIVKDRVDSDAPKKAGTDGLTKLLSQLGFNADVFLGLYDDQKYVAQVREEFKEKAAPAVINDAQWAELTTLISQTGTVAPDICKHYGIASLKELPASRFNGLRQNLSAKLVVGKAA